MRLLAGGTRNVVAGGAISEGQHVRQGLSGKLEAVDITSVDTSDCLGVALTGGLVDQLVVVALNGATIDYETALTVGAVYAVGPTNGNLALESSLITGQFITLLGIPSASNSMRLNIYNSQVAKP